MIEQKVTVSFYLEKTKPNNENKCLVKMTVYSNSNKKRYTTNQHVTIEEWEKLKSPNLRDNNLKIIKQSLNAIEAKTLKAIENISPFSFIAFEEALFSKVKINKNTSLQFWFDNYITKLHDKGSVGTAITYRTTINSLNLFKKNLHLQDITPTLLENYEAFMVEKGKSLTTISIYLRELRAIINQAINAGSFAQDKYPFKKYEIPSGRNVKKSLSEKDISKLLNYKPKKKDELRALDFWLFSYLCSGINFADIISLKPENINGNHLYFYRQKTKRTKKKDLRPIKVGLNPRALEIIEIYKTTDPNNDYLFPVLEPALNAVTIKHRCQRFIKWVNKRMLAIAKDLNIDSKITTYAARHTFGTVLKRKGAPTSFIKDALGHSSVVTTENYLDSFEDDVTLEYANVLTNFKSPAISAVG